MDTLFAIHLLVILFCLFFTLAIGLWVGWSLLLTGIVSALLLTSDLPIGALAASAVWDASSNWVLTCVPLFIWMGEIIFRSRISTQLFEGLAPLMYWVPGRLLHVNIFGCGIMSAISGSSAITCATIARINVPRLRERGYDEGLSIGTLAGAGTLGLLIPPSIMMIVYGVVAEVSITRLFVAGIIPGILLLILFSSYVAIMGLARPSVAPKPSDRENRIRMATIFKSIYLLAPTLILMVFIIGVIYGGIATPTEAAAVGVVGAMVVAALSRDLTLSLLKESIMSALVTSCMLAFLVFCASFLASVMGFTGIPMMLATWVGSLGLTQFELLFALIAVYLLIGCFLDGISMILLTAPIVVPMIMAADIDPLWFGIFVVVMVEVAQITPPVGINLFILQSITNRDFGVVTRSSIPFFLIMLFFTFVLIFFPDLVTYLPSTMRKPG